METTMPTTTTTTAPALTKGQRNAVTRFGAKACIDAACLADFDGKDDATIAFYFNTTRTIARCITEAGRKLLRQFRADLAK